MTAKDNRRFVNGVLWVLRSGAHWKDMPAEYGNWKSVHKRFTRRTRSGIWERIFEVLLEDPDSSYIMIDPTIVTAHHQALCGKGGKGRGSWSLKGRTVHDDSRAGRLHGPTDALDPDRRTGSYALQGVPLLRGIEATRMIAIKGYDTDGIL